MNYTELTAAIEQTCEDDFTTDQLSRFAKQTEQRIYSEVLFPALRKLADPVLAFTQGNQYLNAPADFLAVSALSVVVSGAYTFLVEKDPSFIREAYPTVTATGVPKYYSVFGRQAADANELVFIVGPTPAQAYSTELHYYYHPQSIVDGADTWLGENFDVALLSGALVEAIRFQKGEQDMVKLYGEMYKSALDNLKTIADRQRSDAYRTRGR